MSTLDHAMSDRLGRAKPREAVAACLRQLDAGQLPVDLLAEKITLTAMETGEVTHGRDAVAAMMDLLYRQAFVARSRLRNLVVDGNCVVIEAEFVGIHVGSFAGVSPRRHQVRVAFVAACDLDGHTISAIRVYLPLDALVRQIRDS